MLDISIYHLSIIYLPYIYHLSTMACGRYIDLPFIWALLFYVCVICLEIFSVSAVQFRLSRDGHLIPHSLCGNIDSVLGGWVGERGIRGIGMAPEMK